MVDCKNSVAIELRDWPEQAQRESQRGMVRLFMLQMPQQLKLLRKNLLRGNTISLHLAGISQQRDEWVDDLLFSVFYRIFIADKPLPRSNRDFQQRLQAEKKNLVAEATLAAQVLAIAAIYVTIYKQLKAANVGMGFGYWRYSKTQLSLLLLPVLSKIPPGNICNNIRVIFQPLSSVWKNYAVTISEISNF